MSRGRQGVPEPHSEAIKFPFRKQGNRDWLKASMETLEIENWVAYAVCNAASSVPSGVCATARPSPAHQHPPPYTSVGKLETSMEDCRESHTQQKGAN